MGRNIITFELRSVKDDDIATDLKNAISNEIDRSTIIREALRQYFSQQLHLHIPSPTQHTPQRTEHFPDKSQDVPLVLRKVEKDDTQLDDALNDLLDF